MANPLFMGAPGPSKKDGIIRVMADHGHEGVLVTIQDTENRSEWPETARGVQPKPVTVANGINKVTGKSMPLVSAYDGAPAGVGRIVAHTTWHHFVNVNLHGFLVPEARDKYLLAGIVAQQQETKENRVTAHEMRTNARSPCRREASCALFSRDWTISKLKAELFGIYSTIRSDNRLERLPV